MDAGTLAEADELDDAELTDDAVVNLITGEIALDDAAVTEEGVTMGTPEEDRGLEITAGSTEGIDVSSTAEEAKLGVDVGVADEAVVGGGTGVDGLDVGGTAMGGILDS